MIIAMDTREAEAPQPTGKGLWGRRVWEELQGREIDLLQLDQLQVTSCKLKVLWHWRVAREVKRRKPDVYLSPTSYIVPWLLGRNVKTAIVIHDLIVFDNEPHDKKAKLIERLLLPRVLKTAQWIFTVSDATKDDLLKRFPKTDPKKVTTVYEGPTVNELVTCNFKLETSSPFILNIGTLSPRKNQLRLIKAYNALPEGLRSQTKLILAGGRGWDDEEIVKLAAESPNVEWKGYIDDENLTQLLTQATCLAYPSLKEGFGLPVLDAMTVGTPVLTSDRSSMKEIAGDAALLIDPTSVTETTKGLERMLTDDQLRESLTNKGLERAKVFSWEKTVDILLETIDN